MNIDHVDYQILKILQADGRISNVELARQVGLAPSGVLERVRRLEKRGIIKGYEARLNSTELDHGLIAFMALKTSEPVGVIDLARELVQIPEIQEVHHLAGEDCYLIKLRVRDNAALARLMRDQLSKFSAITATRTTIVLETIKETMQIPVGDTPIGDER